MLLTKSNTIIKNLLIAACFAMLFNACKEQATDGMIVMTQVATNLVNSNDSSVKDILYHSKSRIVALNPNKSGESLMVLSKDFFSACAPNISYDGKQMLFAAQKNQNDPWQIWELNFDNLKYKQVTDSPQNAIDPTYLPDGTIAFSKTVSFNKLNTSLALFTCNLDGTNLKQIGFNPNAHVASSVLMDGRIVAISQQMFPYQSDKNFMILRPDGTKEELFYQGLKGGNLQTRACETSDGKLVFIESDNRNQVGGNVISINYNRPLHSRLNLTSNINGDFYAVSALNANKLLVSYRASKSERFALFEFNIEDKTLEQVIYKDNDFDVLEVVRIQKHERPRKLPSEVNLDSKTGLLLCQDINFNAAQTTTDSTSTLNATKIEVLGIDKSLGIVSVEKDGSFYLKIIADTPFRIQTLDQNNRVVKGPGSWLYLRPSERRGCVGCHEDPEQVPENRQPLSANNNPVLIPVLAEVLNNKVSLK